MDAYLATYVDSVMDAQEAQNGIFRTSFLARLGRIFSTR
jgi:hypothetical protein